eukprot:gnl/MRDRNA2_/MRDRNA2_56766_c0_seq1.p1 gnl/MRDRNA2_/MRDRNA2_56766_c0~~gnl/MRDRNA2_/MRDRNA2_56766_c0_seq1.p1  ORF type:complete len:236 (-),score=39.59 gnl/MRDRNA2_/MRDRNA2_56766_c0_seq1:27-650(-)
MAWQEALLKHFPGLAVRLIAEGYVGSYKQVFARRAQRAADWRQRKESQQKVASVVEESEKGSKHKKKKHQGLFYADNRQGNLADSTLRLKICDRCGEKYSASTNRANDSCKHHTGSLEPRAEPGSYCSRTDIQQVAKFARMAIRNCGGRMRSGKNWAKGLGKPPLVGGRPVCWDGVPGLNDVACVWSCCGGSGLFAEGCTIGQHRHC